MQKKVQKRTQFESFLPAKKQQQGSTHSGPTHSVQHVETNWSLQEVAAELNTET